MKHRGIWSTGAQEHKALERREEVHSSGKGDWRTGVAPKRPKLCSQSNMHKHIAHTCTQSICMPLPSKDILQMHMRTSRHMRTNTPDSHMQSCATCALTCAHECAVCGCVLAEVRTHTHLTHSEAHVQAASSLFVQPTHLVQALLCCLQPCPLPLQVRFLPLQPRPRRFQVRLLTQQPRPLRLQVSIPVPPGT